LSDLLDPEDEAALAVLDKLGRVYGPDETSVPAPQDEVEEVLRRLYHETVGILPYALEPARIDPASRARLLAAIGAGEKSEPPELPLPAAGIFEPLVPPAPAEEPIGAAGAAGELSEPIGGGRAVRAPEPLLRLEPELPGRVAASATAPSRGPWLLAAAALVAAVGLGLFAAYFRSELAAATVRHARIESDLRAESESARTALDDLRRRFDLMTAPATTIYPLRCPTGHGPAAGARVYVYVTPDGRRWAVAAHGLSAEPAGSDYQVWFLVGEQPLSAGCFNLRDGKPVVSMALAPPANATGAAVSIEPRGGSPRPTGPVVLVADHSVRL
jgi:hypothetical protein